MVGRIRRPGGDRMPSIHVFLSAVLAEHQGKLRVLQGQCVPGGGKRPGVAVLGRERVSA